MKCPRLAVEAALNPSAKQRVIRAKPRLRHLGLACLLALEADPLAPRARCALNSAGSIITPQTGQISARSSSAEHVNCRSMALHPPRSGGGGQPVRVFDWCAPGPRAVSHFQQKATPDQPLGQVPVGYRGLVEERRVTVEFGPSRSKRFGKALAAARSGAGECSEVEPGRYRVRFALAEDAADYAGLATLLQHVRHWRATEVFEGDEPMSVYHATEMAWCASSQLKSFGACRFRFFYGVFPRCSVCPLFDGERAIRDVLGENPPPGLVFEITPGPNLSALLGGEFPPEPGESDVDVEIPDYPPAEWGEPAGEDPAG